MDVMVREVCLYETAELETVRVCVPTSDIMTGQLDWLRENGTGVFSWRQGSRSGFSRSHFAVFIFSDPDTALAFKLRWA